jgi:hypothetical protein
LRIIRRRSGRPICFDPFAYLSHCSPSSPHLASVTALAVATLSVLWLSKLTGAEQAAPPGESTEKASEPEMASRGEPKLVRAIKFGDCVSTKLPLNQFAALRKGAPAKTFLKDIDE